MDEYEIRVPNSKLSFLAFVEILEPNDATAICSAKRIANDRAVEVWHDLDCIYRYRMNADG